MSDTVAPTTATRWDELQGLALRDATERTLLDRLVREWAREERLERELAGDLLDHLRQQLELCSDVGIDVNRGTVDGGGHEPGRLRA